MSAPAGTPKTPAPTRTMAASRRTTLASASPTASPSTSPSVQSMARGSDSPLAGSFVRMPKLAHAHGSGGGVAVGQPASRVDQRRQGRLRSILPGRTAGARSGPIVHLGRHVLPADEQPGPELGLRHPGLRATRRLWRHDVRRLRGSRFGPPRGGADLSVVFVHLAARDSQRGDRADDDHADAWRRVRGDGDNASDAHRRPAPAADDLTLLV
jgi:hypothetical protein